MVWFDKLEEKKRKPAIVTDVKRSEKGIILNTSDYSVFLYSSSQMAIHILEALTVWVADGYGKGLKIVPDKKAKNGYRIELVEEVTAWFPSGSGYSQIEEESSQENPFL